MCITFSLADIFIMMNMGSSSSNLDHGVIARKTTGYVPHMWVVPLCGLQLSGGW